MPIVQFTAAPFPGRVRNRGGHDVALEIPQNFDPNRPPVMVMYFHGHGATLKDDILKRQQLVEELQKSGVNAVLVAPQLMYNVDDTNPGRFTDPKFVKEFLAEAQKKLAKQYTDRFGGDLKQAETAFNNSSIIVTTYSGGYAGAAGVINTALLQKDPEAAALNNRIKGLVGFDTTYGSYGNLNSTDLFTRFLKQDGKLGIINYITAPDGQTRAQSEAIKKALPASIVAGEKDKLDLTGASQKRVAIYEVFNSASLNHTKLIEKTFGQTLQRIAQNIDRTFQPTQLASYQPNAAPNVVVADANTPQRLEVPQGEQKTARAPQQVAHVDTTSAPLAPVNLRIQPNATPQFTINYQSLRQEQKKERPQQQQIARTEQPAAPQRAEEKPEKIASPPAASQNLITAVPQGNAVASLSPQQPQVKIRRPDF